jgi:hypothetical protein
MQISTTFQKVEELFLSVTGCGAHETEPSVPDPSHSEIEVTTKKLKNYKSPGSNRILTELIPEECETLQSEIRTLINSNWNKEKLSMTGRKEKCMWDIGRKTSQKETTNMTKSHVGG